MNEDVTFHPACGVVDEAAVDAWLGAQPWAFLDPVEEDGWHLSGSAEQVRAKRARRLADPQRFPPGVRVLLFRHT